MDIYRTAEGLLIEAALAVVARLAPGSTLRRISLTLEAPHGRQVVHIDPAAWYLARAREQRLREREALERASERPNVERPPAAGFAAITPSAPERTSEQPAVEQTLNDAERTLLAVLDGQVLTGPQIAAAAGYKYGYVRQLLSGLVRRGLLGRTTRGYVRPIRQLRDTQAPGGDRTMPCVPATEGDGSDHDDDRDTG